MREDSPSATALRVAVRRAAHQLLDNPKVFEDALALSMIGAQEASLLTSAPEQSDTGASRHLRAFLAARSRFAEDELAGAIERGTRQYVILGAGLDTFAYRNPYRDLQVFEVDHPATQGWKRRRLEAEGISVPGSLTFVPVDFEKQTFLEALYNAGFKPEGPAFFSWLGVTPYLAKDIVLSTLRLIFSTSAGGGVAFDYALPRSSLGPLQQIAFDALATRVAAAGEPFQGFFDPKELAENLRSIGFRNLEDLDSAKINARYFKDRADGLRVGGDLAHLMCARD